MCCCVFTCDHFTLTIIRKRAILQLELEKSFNSFSCFTILSDSFRIRLRTQLRTRLRTPAHCRYLPLCSKHLRPIFPHNRFRRKNEKTCDRLLSENHLLVVERNPNKHSIVSNLPQRHLSTHKKQNASSCSPGRLVSCIGGIHDMHVRRRKYTDLLGIVCHMLCILQRPFLDHGKPLSCFLSSKASTKLLFPSWNTNSKQFLSWLMFLKQFETIQNIQKVQKEKKKSGSHREKMGCL